MVPDLANGPEQEPDRRASDAGDGTTPPAAGDANRGPSAGSTWSRWYRGAWVAAVLVVLLTGAWVQASLGGERVTELFADGVVAGGAVAAAIAVTWLARDANVPERRAWLLLAAGLWTTAAAEVLWFAINLFSGSVPYPGPPEPFYLAGYPLIAAGLVLLAVDPRDSRPWLRFALDGLVVASALLLLAWHFVLDPLMASSTLGSLETWVSLAYPLLDVLVASIALVLAVNTRGPRRGPLLLIAVGLFAWVVGDVGFATLEFAGGYVYDSVGLFWLLGDLAIALGALHPSARAPVEHASTRRYEYHELAYPFVPFLVAAFTAAVLGFQETLDAGDAAFFVLVLATFLARQAHVFRDVVRLERDLEASERGLANRNEELLLINRIVRHDIRNDMAVASGWAGELERHVDEEGEEMLESIQHSTQHAIELTETLRDFVDALEPGQDAETGPTALSPILRSAVETARESHPAATFVVDDVPDVRVEANALLGTVFHNVLTNAVVHNDREEPTVEVTTAASDGSVRVRIADDGPGIPDDAKATVFGRGSKGLDSPGSGIGLYLVDTLVEQYGGSVTIEDREPKGAVFEVALERAD